MKISRHAEKRSQQRALSPDILDVIMKHGRTSYGPDNVRKLFFGNKEFSNAISEVKKIMKTLERARGGTIILSEDQIVTVYKQH